MKKNRYIMLILISTLQGCMLFQSKTVECKTQIDYSGYNVQVTGLDIPVGGVNVFRIGKLEFKPEKVQEAKETTQALDLLQFSDCQFALLVPKEQVLEIRKHREATLAALAELLKSINAATTETEHQVALDAGKKKLADLQQEAHETSGSTKP
ncbi:hypothetical protein V3O24_07740 [Methylobacter sp. Wu8]|uniref:hypothetical protein n=1 Tax=Methylobacter sp. Wu8 TaxID=3118457 RepID=UPI002F318D47